MSYRIAPADRNHLAKNDTLSFSSDGEVSQTHCQGLRSMVVYGTLHKEPAELLSIAVGFPPEHTGAVRGCVQVPQTGPELGWRRGYQACLLVVVERHKCVDTSPPWWAVARRCIRLIPNGKGLPQETCRIPKTVLWDEPDLTSQHKFGILPMKVTHYMETAPWVLPILVHPASPSI